MALGALAMIIFQQITLEGALIAVNWNVILFLLGMFFLGQAIEESGWLTNRLEVILDRVGDRLFLAFFIFGVGLLSAFFMNDTLAIIGTPVTIYCIRQKRYPAIPMLIALCFAITIGSTFSPIGNPQNLLIAMQANIKNPFLTYFIYLFIPSLINLAILYLLLCFWIRKGAKVLPKLTIKKDRRDIRLSSICKWSVALLCLLILLQVPLIYISLIPAFLIFLFSKKRLKILQDVDWQALVFFISLFIVMQAVWDHLPSELAARLGDLFQTRGGILVASTVLSQIISNVPSVALMLPLIPSGERFAMALAAGSTIAGNLLILGAASNVIVVEKAEKMGIKPFSFFQFMKYGFFLTIINLFVYLAYFAIL